MRITKDPKIRRAEIVDAATILFTTKGYEQTSVADIIKAVDIAKGTFYYYFPSKEALLDDIIKKQAEKMQAAGEAIVAKTNLTALEKIQELLISGQTLTDDVGGIVEEFHKVPNGEMHIRSLIQSAEHMTPSFVAIIQQGVEEGTFTMKYPAETIEMFLFIGQFFFDRALFSHTDEAVEKKAIAYAYLLEQVTGTAPGTFDFMIQAVTRKVDY